jgi:hypothetical protein
MSDMCMGHVVAAQLSPVKHVLYPWNAHGHGVHAAAANVGAWHRAVCLA